MSEPTTIPQYQIDHIVMAVKTAMADSNPRLIESVANTIRQELTSPASMTRFDNLLERYHKSNSDLTNKFDSFNQNILQNQSQMAALLKQVIDSSSATCPNNPDLEEIRCWFDEILHGSEYMLKQQIRDLLESGVARKLRNVVITYITITAAVAVITAVIGYFAMSSAIEKSVAPLLKKSIPTAKEVDDDSSTKP